MPVSDVLSFDDYAALVHAMPAERRNALLRAVKSQAEALAGPVNVLGSSLHNNTAGDGSTDAYPGWACIPLPATGAKRAPVPSRFLPAALDGAIKWSDVIKDHRSASSSLPKIAYPRCDIGSGAIIVSCSQVWQSWREVSELFCYVMTACRSNEYTLVGL